MTYTLFSLLHRLLLPLAACLSGKRLVNLLLCSMFLLNYPARADDEPMLDYLYFEAFLEMHPLGSTIDTVTFDYEHFYIAIEQLNELLDLHVEWQPDTRQLTGWYIREQNQVALTFDAITSSGTVRGKAVTLTADDWVIDDDLLYIRSDALSRIFGISTDIRMARLLVNFSTEDTHPMIARLARQERHRLATIKSGASVQYPTLPDQYQRWSYPNLDVQLSPAADHGASGWNKDINLSINAVADLLYHGSELSYSQNKTNKSARGRFYRNLTLNDKPFYYEWGDIYGVSNPFLTASKGVGFAFVTSDQSLQNRNTRRFEGAVPAGWDVELYRNESVIDYQLVGDDGYYLFDDVPVANGRNQFNVVMYGPSGEVREQPITFNNTIMLAAPGAIIPEFSYVLGKRQLFFTKPETTYEPTLSSLFHLGLAERLNLTLGYIHQQSETSDELNIATTTLSGYNSLFRYRLDSALRPSTGDIAYNTDINVIFEDGDLAFRFQDTTQLYPDASESLSLSYIPFEPAIDFSLQAQSTRENGSWRSSVSGTISKRFDELSISGGLNWDQSSGTRVSQQASWRSTLGTLQLQLRGDIGSQSRITQGNLSWRGRWGSYSYQANSRMDFKKDQHTFRFSLSKTFDAFRFGSQISWDSDHRLGIGLNISFGTALTPLPEQPSSDSMSSFATIHAITFQDDNYNGLFDENEQALTDIGYRGSNHWRTIRSDNSGIARLPKAKGRQPQAIAIDPVTLEDPFMFIPNEGFLVQGHPGGVNEIHFAVQKTGEIEGELAIKRGDALAPKGAVPLLLLDSNGNTVKQVHTEFDGFFIFDRILPGDYQLVVEASYLQRQQLTQPERYHLSIDPQQESLIVIDNLTLLAPEPEQQPDEPALPSDTEINAADTSASADL